MPPALPQGGRGPATSACPSPQGSLSWESSSCPARRVGRWVPRGRPSKGEDGVSCGRPLARRRPCCLSPHFLGLDTPLLHPRETNPLLPCPPSRLIRVSWALLCPFISGPWASSPGRDSPLEPAQTWPGACPGPASSGGGGGPPPCECDLQVDVRVSFTFTPGWWPSRPREWQPRAEAHSVVADSGRALALLPQAFAPSLAAPWVPPWLFPFVCS